MKSSVQEWILWSHYETVEYNKRQKHSALKVFDLLPSLKLRAICKNKES